MTVREDKIKFLEFASNLLFRLCREYKLREKRLVFIVRKVNGEDLECVVPHLCQWTGDVYEIFFKGHDDFKTYPNLECLVSAQASLAAHIIKLLTT